MDKKPKRPSPRLPDWLIERIDKDIAALGKGAQRHGGAQSVFMAALLLYLELPEGDRLELAETMTSRQEGSVRRDLDAHWIARAIQAVSALGEAETMAFVEGMEARLAQIRSNDTGEESQTGARRRNTRRQGA